MNSKLNIKTLSLGIVMVLAMLAFGGLAVQAQTTTTTTATDAPVDSSITLVVKGSVTDPSGNVTVNGQATIFAKRVVDTTSVANPSIVLLDFDFSQITGTSGSTKATLKNYVTGDNHATEIRPLQASDTVIVPMPYYDSTKDALSARTMLVSVTLNFDVGTGKLTGGSISVGNNVVTSAAVGTTTTAQPIQ
jgi:hypothetical protein